MAIPRKPTEGDFLNARKPRARPKQAYPIRLNPELYEWLSGFADRADRSMADVIRSSLREYREKHDA